MRKTRTLLLPCLLLLAVTLPHMGQGDFRRDTPRYAAVGLYMWSGGDLLAPHLGPDVPYFNKPPLAFWIHGLFLRVLGPNLVAARLPSILAALGVLILSVLTVRKIASETEAVVSGIVLALTYEYFRRTREISLDFWQLLFVMLAAFLFLSGVRQGATLKIVLSGAGIGLALLCKPFVALGLIPIFAAWLAVARIDRPGVTSSATPARGPNFRRFSPLLALSGATALAILVALPWHLYMSARFGEAFPRQYIFHEVIGRAQGATGKEPFHHYLVSLVSTYWPWLLAVGYAVYCRFGRPGPHREGARDLVPLAGIWFLWILVLISLFPDKSPNYALPLYPALSWIAAAGLCRLPWPILREWYLSGFKGLVPLALCVLLGVSLAPFNFLGVPSKEWLMLFAWMKKNSIAPNQVGAATLKPNDRCYFYLKTGWWLPEVQSQMPNDSPAWLLTRRENLREDIQAAADFTAGNFQIFAATNWASLQGERREKTGGTK